MNLTEAVRKKITRFYLLGMLIIFATTTTATIFFTYRQKVAISQSYIDSIKNDLLIGDYRSVKVAFTNALKTGNFRKISLRTRAGTPLVSLESPNNFSILFWPMSWTELIALDNNSSLGSFIEFQFNALELLPFLVSIWLLIFVISIPIFLRNISILNHQHQEELKRQKLEHAGRLARQVAHDLRSPISAIRIFASEAKWQDFEKSKNFDSALVRINSIAEDLLHFNEYSQEIVVPAETNMNTALEASLSPENRGPKIQSLLPTIEGLIEEKRAEISLQSKSVRLSCSNEVPEEDMQKFLCVKESDLLRVLSNLINNSYEAIAESGFISISNYTDDRYFYVEVRDNGCGMDASSLEKVFEEGLSVGKESGFGLGLSHAKKILLSAGGNIQMISNIGVGTTVKISVLKMA